jgi:hypothetical protein
MRLENNGRRVGKDLEGHGGGYFNALSWRYLKELEYENHE